MESSWTPVLGSAGTIYAYKRLNELNYLGYFPTDCNLRMTLACVCNPSGKVLICGEGRGGGFFPGFFVTYNFECNHIGIPLRGKPNRETTREQPGTCPYTLISAPNLARLRAGSTWPGQSFLAGSCDQASIKRNRMLWKRSSRRRNFNERCLGSFPRLPCRPMPTNFHPAVVNCWI